MVLRPMTPPDIDAVHVLEQATNPYPWPHHMFVDELELDPSSCSWIVSEVDVGGVRTIIGFGGVIHGDGKAHIMSLAVDDRWRRRGVGRNLWHGLVHRAREVGAVSLSLEVRVSNAGAIALYRSLGMNQAGIVPAYYGDGEDALAFELAGLEQVGSVKW